MDLDELAGQLGEALLRRGWSVATAESCTGGWVAKTLTDIAGSSRWFDRGFVTYSNQSKIDMLGVQMATLTQFGAVSDEIVREMALGARARSRADISVAISGVAGPSGGSAEKPVGTVCFAWAFGGDGQVQSVRHRFDGDREAVRRQAVIHAIRGLIDRVERGR